MSRFESVDFNLESARNMQRDEIIYFFRLKALFTLAQCNTLGACHKQTFALKRQPNLSCPFGTPVLYTKQHPMRYIGLN